MRILWRQTWLLGLLLPALALGGGGQNPHPSAAPGAQEIADPQPFVESVEYFVLEWPKDRPHPATDFKGSRALVDAALARQIGVVVMRRSQLEGAPQLELEVDFPFEKIRVMAVECQGSRSPRLVWREVSGGAGRTVFAEWSQDNRELRVLEWGLEGRLRDHSSTEKGAVMPQYLLELVRMGRVTSGSFEVFDPLSHALETLTLSTAYQRESSELADYTRRTEFHRLDGTLAGSYVFRGTELLRFQWQSGGALARRISAQEYDQLRARWVAPELGLEEAFELQQALSRQPRDPADISIPRQR